MAGTATRIGVADFAYLRPGCDEFLAGTRCNRSHCRNREAAGTMRSGRYPRSAGTLLEPTAGWRDRDARGQKFEQKEFPEDGGRSRRAGFDTGRGGRNCGNCSATIRARRAFRQRCRSWRRAANGRRRNGACRVGESSAGHGLDIPLFARQYTAHRRGSIRHGALGAAIE